VIFFAHTVVLMNSDIGVIRRETWTDNVRKSEAADDDSEYKSE